MPESLNDYVRTARLARESFQAAFARGQDSPRILAAARGAVELMEEQLRKDPAGVLAFNFKDENNRTGSILWHFQALLQADRPFDHGSPDFQAFQRKLDATNAFVGEFLAKRTAWREVFENKQAGISYLVQENDLVVRILNLIMNRLREWNFERINDADFLKLSPLGSLARLLDEEKGWLIALRAAQLLPLEVDKQAIVVERPDYVFVVELVIGFIPLVGNVVAAYEAISGQDIFGYALDPAERAILAASVLLPMAGRIVKGGRAMYTANRMAKLYGRDARTWTELMDFGEKLSKDAQALRAMREAKTSLEKAVGAKAAKGSRAPSIPAATTRELAAGIRRLRQATLASRAAPAAAAAVSEVPAAALQAFEQLAAKFPILKELDARAAEFVLRDGGTAGALKGRLLEALLETRVAPMVRDAAGPAALGLRNARKPLEFIPGHLLRDASSRQITDGILAHRLPPLVPGGPERLEILVIFEAKAGKAASRELALAGGSLSSLTKAEREELRRYARDVLRDLREEARLKGATVTKKVEDIEKEIALSEKGGQVRRDIERLAPGADGKPTLLKVGSVETQVIVSPKQTKVIGVLPRNLKPNRMTRELKDLGYNFEAMGIDISTSELDSIGRELEKSLAAAAATVPKP